MAAKIYTISVPMEQDIFLQENPDIKLSKICQDSINKVMELRKSATPTLEKLKHTNDLMKVLLIRANEFIASKNLWAEFCAIKYEEKEDGIVQQE